MRIRLICCLILSILFGFELCGQSKDISLKLLNQSTKKPVSGVHVFIANTTFGAVSDKNGLVLLSIPEGLSEDLFISHVSYEMKLLNHSLYMNLNNEETILMVPNMIELAELTLKVNRSKKWKKKFKKFEKAFIGSDKIAKKCKILNPEVLRFEEKEGGFVVTAIDLIHIDNPYLAYEILYLLKRFEIADDGSVEYLGRSRFIDNTSDSDIEEVAKRRNEIYLNSPKYFFKTLIDDNLGKAGFKLDRVKYKNGNFVFQKSLNREEMIDGPSASRKYTLAFDDFLQVYNVKTKSVTFGDTGIRQGGLESQKFSTGGKTENAIVNYDISQLYKISPYVILNEFGNVLNSKDIKEYGYWAYQKVAHQLPFDYSNDYIGQEIANIELKNNTNYDLLSSLIYENDRNEINNTLELLEANWEPGYLAPLIELIRFNNKNFLTKKIKQILNIKYDLSVDSNYYDLLQWLWLGDFPNEDYYFKFKSELYKNIDSRFEKYFANQEHQALIDLDEVVWGGVHQDGIPPLRKPEMIKADEADYLSDSDVVFGIYINGEARAYPKRILAWHEFFTDDFDEFKIAGVYCTLCGTVIVYNMDLDGVHHELGTSGFLFQSNKLMYDHSTQSLWSTIDGKPVIGPLVNKNILLKSFPVVTSSWKEWRRRHPGTKVLSLNTAYSRDYSEGAAYRDYFSTDDLMFPVKALDKRLNNKDEVLIVRADSYKEDPLAILVKYLIKKKWLQVKIGEQSIIVLTDNSGAARAYDAQNIKFKNSKNGVLYDSLGQQWQLKEDYLVNETNDRLNRVVAHNIFWFAWYNAYPETRLIK